MEKTVLRRESLSKQVSDRLEEMISSGQYRVGDKLPPEPELMALFQVSRNTLREAIQSLTWSGLLSVKQGDGTYVSAADRFHANMEQKYQAVSLRDIKEARDCIEVTIAHLSARQRTEEDVQTIQAMLRKRRALAADEKENTRSDLDFHIAVARACHNTILIDMYESISCYLENQIAERSKASTLPPQEIDALHEALFDAIQAGDSDQAVCSAMQILDI